MKHGICIWEYKHKKAQESIYFLHFLAVRMVWVTMYIWLTKLLIGVERNPHWKLSINWLTYASEQVSNAVVSIEGIKAHRMPMPL